MYYISYNVYMVSSYLNLSVSELGRWGLVPFSSIVFDAALVGLDPLHGDYAPNFWLRYPYYRKMQDIDWQRVRGQLCRAVEHYLSDGAHLAEVSGTPRERSIMMEWERGQVALNDEGDGRYTVYSGNHRILLMANAPFQVDLCRRIGFVVSRMYGDGRWRRLSDQRVSDHDLVPAMIYS